MMDSLIIGLLDKLCDKLDESGIEGNVIERDPFGEPYVNIWYGKFEDPPRERPEAFTVIITDYSLCFSSYGCYEIKPPEKYCDYFKDTFMACVSRRSGFYVMSADQIVRTIKFLFNREKMEKKKENNMNKIIEQAANSLFSIIMYETNKSPLRWVEDKAYNTIYICNSDYDKVCRVQIYETSLKNSPVRAYYYVYFIGKYCSIAKDIKDPRIEGITEADGYKFVLPRHVVDFVREVVRLKERGGVLMARGCGKTAFQMYQYYREVLGMLDIINPDSCGIEDVIFNDPATIIIWSDGTKTVVKAENEEFDPEKGLAMAISKKVLGNKYDYYDVFKKYVGRYEKKQKKGKK